MFSRFYHEHKQHVEDLLHKYETEELPDVLVEARALDGYEVSSTCLSPGYSVSHYGCCGGYPPPIKRADPIRFNVPAVRFSYKEPRCSPPQ